MDHIGGIPSRGSRVAASFGCLDHGQRHRDRRQSPAYRPQWTATPQAAASCHTRPPRPGFQLQRCFDLSRRTFCSGCRTLQPRNSKLPLECGPDLAFNAIRAGIIDKIVAFVAPKIMGGREIPAIGGEGIEKLSEAIPLKNFIVTRAGPDVVLTAYVHRNR